MSSTKKLEEKHSKIIRQLQSQEPNKVCAECPIRGPGFVNLHNSTFICMRCSGLIRDFGHRVKSVSAATFTPEEIKGLQLGGNLVAQKIWLGNWNPNTARAPDGNDANALKEWMRMKYVVKRWYNASAVPQVSAVSDAQEFGAFESTDSPAVVMTKQQSAANVTGHDLYQLPAATQSSPLPHSETGSRRAPRQQSVVSKPSTAASSNMNDLLSMSEASPFDAAPQKSQQQSFQADFQGAFGASNHFGASDALTTSASAFIAAASPFAAAPVASLNQPSNNFGSPVFQQFSQNPAKSMQQQAAPVVDKYDIFRNEASESSSVFGAKAAAANPFGTVQQPQGQAIFGGQAASVSAGASPFASAGQSPFTSAANGQSPFASVSSGASPFGNIAQPPNPSNAFGLSRDQQFAAQQIQQSPFASAYGQAQQPQFQQQQNFMQQSQFGANANPFANSGAQGLFGTTASAPTSMPQQPQSGQNPFGNSYTAQTTPVVQPAAQPRMDPFAGLVGQMKPQVAAQAQAKPAAQTQPAQPIAAAPSDPFGGFF